MRFVIVGNCGSGKSTLGERLGRRLGVGVHDLDRTHWLADGRKRREDEAKAMVASIARADSWVVEGVYGWLAEVALGRADAFVWLDLDWKECREGILRRPPRTGAKPGDRQDLLDWAQAYWTRLTPSSFSGHERLFLEFAGAKARLTTREDATGFALAQLAGRAGTTGAGASTRRPPLP